MNELESVSGLELALKASLEHEVKLKSISNDVEILKGTLPINEEQAHEIKRSASKVVTSALGGKESIAHKKIRLRVFSAFWREFKQHFTLPRYGDLPRVKFDDAMRYIDMWRPQTNLMLEIQELNGQQTMEWSDGDEQ